MLSVQCNCTCTHLSVVTTGQADQVGSILHIVEIEGNNKISYHMNTLSGIGLESDSLPGGQALFLSVNS